ncbi:MAG TPA: DUF2339 domain-containing protein [Gaiellaceae bacterium]|nr:DUF2339 domain-containing protein [Gaiellaceae bacterium]
MDATVEQRLQFLEERMKTVEGLLGVGVAPAQVREPFPAAPAPAKPAAEPKPPLDLEELLGGRVLGWVGGIAVVIAAVFFVVMAVRNGWIGEAARMELAFAGSAVLVAVGSWLYEHRGQTQAALATVAAGFAALYASDAATTVHYHLLSSSVGLVIAGVVGALALATAVRWNSQEVAGIGIVGSLLAPVFVDAGTHTSSLVFMTIALVAAIGVVIQRRWAWLAAIAYVVSVPQAASWLDSEHTAHIGLTLVVATAFWLLYVVAAVGHELLVPTKSLRLSSASLLFANASIAAAGGWWLIDDAGHRAGANAWLFAVACAHIALGTLVFESRASREIAMLLYGVSATLVGSAVSVALDGPALVAAWSIEAIVLAWVARRTDTPRRGLAAALVFAGLAGLHTLLFEARPDSLAYGLHSVPSAVGAVALVLLALAGIAVAYEDVAERLAWSGAALSVYLVSGLVVDLGGAHAEHSTQTSQLALSGFWGTLGFAGIVAGLIRHRRALRLGGLGLLTLAVGKVFFVDLANLESIWRVGSFLAVGLLLLAGAFAYQRVSRVPLADERRLDGAH